MPNADSGMRPPTDPNTPNPEDFQRSLDFADIGVNYIEHWNFTEETFEPHYASLYQNGGGYLDQFFGDEVPTLSALKRMAKFSNQSLLSYPLDSAYPYLDDQSASVQVSAETGEPSSRSYGWRKGRMRLKSNVNLPQGYKLTCLRVRTTATVPLEPQRVVIGTSVFEIPKNGRLSAEIPADERLMPPELAWGGQRYVSTRPLPIEFDVAKISHNAASGELDDSKKESTGAFLPLNSDDDDYSATLTNLGSDKDQTGAITGENDLLPIYLKKLPQLTGAKFLLDIPSKIKVWKNSNRQDEVTATTEFDASVDTTVYAEGVSKGSDLLKLTLRHGGQDKADIARLKVTVFELKGVLNVPGYTAYSYTADGSFPTGSKWGTPTSGSVKSGSTATQATILWDQGPVVGKAVYEVSSDYVWDLEVNVVEIALGSTNTVTYNGPPTQQAVGSVSIASGTAPAVKGRREISKVTGPTVGSANRGEQFIEVGWVQNGTFTASHAVYNGFTPPARRVSSAEGQGPLLDSLGTAPPAWYGTAADFYHVGGATSPFTLEFRDTPSQWGSDNMNLTIGMTTDAADQFHIRYDFTCYLAVRTTQSINASDQIYTQRSKMIWHFDGGGTIANGVWTGTTADTGGNATYSEVKTGDPVPVTTGNTMNAVLLAPQTWTTHQP